jgi:hypothetical protein
MKTATDSTADAPALPAARPSEDADSSPTDPPRTDVSWVARCQRQFGDDDDRRLRNLADDENCAFYGGV